MLKEANESEWVAPYFSETKERMIKVLFLSDFWNLNRQLENIRHTPCQNYVIYYETWRDLDVGYYDIGLSEKTSNICPIIIS